MTAARDQLLCVIREELGRDVPPWTMMAEKIADRLAELPLRDRLAVLLTEEERKEWAVVPRVATAAMHSAITHLDFTSQTDVSWAEGYAVMLAAAEQEEPK